LRLLLKLAVPILLANILQTSYQITDAFWVGSGAAAVAAVSVSFPVLILMVAKLLLNCYPVAIQVSADVLEDRTLDHRQLEFSGFVMLAGCASS
jgi:Na+-driven multidrug efflux pump